jgi:hypothetical protein
LSADESISIGRLETVKYGVVYVVDRFSLDIALKILDEIARQKGWVNNS